MMMTVVQWVAEQWCGATAKNFAEGEPPVVVDVVVPAAMVAEVVAEAEALTAAAALVFA